MSGFAAAQAAPASDARVAHPPRSIPPQPDYTRACAPSGVDTSATCLQVALQAIDNARAREHVAPMALPGDFAQLSQPDQLLVAVNRERVDRGIPAISALTSSLDSRAQQGADGSRLPPEPGRGFSRTAADWIGGVANSLDALYQWMYDDGPGSDTPGCSRSDGRGCWLDRQILLGRYPGGTLVMGAALDPNGDRSEGDQGGTSLAVVLASSDLPSRDVTYTWEQALADTGGGALSPVSAPPPNVSATHLSDPGYNVPPNPDYPEICAPRGLDNSPRCTQAVLGAIDNARAREGVGPMVLPANFGALSLPEQLLVVIDRERVDRGLPPFAGLTRSLDANAQHGANTANDPPDPGSSYPVVDTEWAGGASNALDADYGWMYNDGPGSSNLDCPRSGGKGCWGHRNGILDNFGTVGTMVMGAAVDRTGDNNAGDKRGTSIAATLAVTDYTHVHFVFTWRAAAEAPRLAPSSNM